MNISNSNSNSNYKNGKITNSNDANSRIASPTLSPMLMSVSASKTNVMLNNNCNNCNSSKNSKSDSNNVNLIECSDYCDNDDSTSMVSSSGDDNELNVADNT